MTPGVRVAQGEGLWNAAIRPAWMSCSTTRRSAPPCCAGCCLGWSLSSSPLSARCAAASSAPTPTTTSAACSPTSRARTLSPSPTFTTASARACRSSSDRPAGTTAPSSPSWPARSGSASVSLAACWSSTPPPSPSRARSPSACSGSGAAGWANSRAARSASTSATSPVRGTPWSTSASTCPKSGPRIASAARRRACPGRCASVPGTSWPYRCSTSTAARCRTVGSPGTARWAAARGSASSCGGAASATCCLVRDLVPPDPPYSGHGRRRRVPFVRADEWRAAVAEDAWETVEVRDGEKGPLLTQVAWTLVQAKTEGKASDVAESLLVFREQQSDGSWKHDYLLSNEVASDPPVELAWVYKAEHRIEECIKQAKGEAGLADYQVRTWEGWHHHQCLSLLAAWLLGEEARRGKKPDAGSDGAASAGADRRAAQPGAESQQPGPDVPHRQPPAQAQRGGPTLPLAATQTLASSTL